MMNEHYKSVLASNNIKENDYINVCLSADKTTYEVKMKDGTVRTIPSGFDYLED